MTTAFVLPGGASLGACQAGMVQALGEAGVRPDVLVGSSAGAINAVFLGLHPGADGVAALIRMWSSFRRRQLVRFRPMQVALALAGYRSALFDRSGMESVLGQELGSVTLEQLTIPVAVMATDAVNGQPVLLREGSALTAVLASSAMPGIFPPIAWSDRWLIDGSVAADAPAAAAQELGGDDIWILTTASQPTRPPRGALELAVHAFSLVTGTATAAEVHQVQTTATVHILPPSVRIDPGIFDFSHGAQLIDEAYETTSAWLRDGQPTEPSPASIPTTVPETMQVEHHRFAH
jgi:NTE family protein